jgi:hypothetical protein
MILSPPVTYRLSLSHRHERHNIIRKSFSQNNTPGSLAFHRDMLLDIPLVADLITIRNSSQAIIDESLRVANLHRLNHDYRVGKQILFKV